MRNKNQQASLTEKLAPELEECKKAKKIVIGISGGADSVALTHILFSCVGPERLLCVHVNHMLRGKEAQRDEDFVRDFCKELGISLDVVKADVRKLAEEQKIGEEECGRRVRYSTFTERTSSPDDLIVTAHNAEDNAETILLNLARGTGLNGLMGIPVRRGNIFRPLLSVSRKEIEAYCEENHLSYVTDSSNLGEAYSRNKIRHKILPVLNEVNSAAVKNILRTSKLVQEDQTFLEQESERAVSSMRDSGKYNICKAKKLSKPVLSRAVRRILQEQGCEHPENKHIDEIMKLLFSSGSCMVPPQKLVTVKQNILTVTAAVKVQADRKEVHMGENSLSDRKILVLREKFLCENEKINNLLFNNCVDYDTIKGVLTVGTREQGDKISLPRRNVTKTLKKLFQEEKIPAALRDEVMVLKENEQVVFVEGVGPDSKYAVTDRTKHIIEFLFLPVDN